jgi:multidrug resistance efflux pump
MIQRGERPQVQNNGAHGAHARQEDDDAAAESWSYQLTFLQAAVIPTMLIALLVVFGFAAVYWSEQTFYVATDNATVTGDPVHVAAPTAGQVRALLVEVGDAVEPNQVLATMVLGGGAQLQLRAPIDGLVVARSGGVGETVQAGRSLVTLVDPEELWVEARVEESRIGRLRVGQRAEVWLDTIGGPYGGVVAAVAGASNTSTTVQTPAAGPFIKLTQWVPVKIQLDPGTPGLVLGGSASIRVRVDA